MRHPREGVLRRLLDEPAGVSTADRRHVHDCAVCRGVLDDVRRDADLVRQRFAGLAAPDADVGADVVDVELAWRRASATASSPSGGPRRPWRGRLQLALRRPSAAALAVAVVLGGAGAAAANDWFRIFRTEQVSAVSIDEDDLVALPDLSAYGQLVVTDGPQLSEAPDAAAAAERSGVEVPVVGDLPRGVSGSPSYQVLDQVSATFTFSAARAAATAADLGADFPSPPSGLDGSSVRLVAGPGVAQLWTSDAGAPALLVGRTVAPTAFSSGAPFEVVGDYLLGLPGLPADLAAQLRGFTADGSTLPLPVPAEEVATAPTEVRGRPATLLTSRDEAFSAVVWVDGGLVTVVAGSLDEQEVLSVARDLR